MIWNRRVRELEQRLATVQHTLGDVLTASTSSSQYPDSNPYSQYASQIAALASKYDGTAEWGNGVCRNVVDIRAAFIIGDGIEPTGDGRELDFIRAFMERNNLDEEVPQEWAKEAEIEGKFCARLYLNGDQIDVRFFPYSQFSYTVETDPVDYARYTRITYRDPGGSEQFIPESEFVYKRFGGRTHTVNNTPPKLGTLLRHMEALDKALVDWRKINHLFASPTPHFRCETASEANSLYQKLKDINWKIGRFLASTAEFILVGPPAGGIEALEKEAVANAKIISGGSGVPVHFLGYPELLSNRATAENLEELVTYATKRERRIWVGAYEELFKKVITLASEKIAGMGGMNPDAVGVVVRELSSKRLKELAEVWLPLREAGEISRETFLSKVPDIDIQAETARLDADDQARAERAAALVAGGEE